MCEALKGYISKHSTKPDDKTFKTTQPRKGGIHINIGHSPILIDPKDTAHRTSLYTFLKKA